MWLDWKVTTDSIRPSCQTVSSYCLLCKSWAFLLQSMLDFPSMKLWAIWLELWSPYWLHFLRYLWLAWVDFNQDYCCWLEVVTMESKSSSSYLAWVFAVASWSETLLSQSSFLVWKDVCLVDWMLWWKAFQLSWPLLLHPQSHHPTQWTQSKVWGCSWYLLAYRPFFCEESKSLKRLPDSL